MSCESLALWEWEATDSWTPTSFALVSVKRGTGRRMSRNYCRDLDQNPI